MTSCANKCKKILPGAGVNEGKHELHLGGVDERALHVFGTRTGRLAPAVLGERVPQLVPDGRAFTGV